MVERSDASLDRIFHALSDASRRGMLQRLTQGSLSVTELAEPLPMSLAAASKHIRVLEDSGLIRREIKWRTHICTLNAEPLAAVQTWVEAYEAFWDERFDVLEELLAERQGRRRKRK